MNSRLAQADEGQALRCIQRCTTASFCGSAGPSATTASRVVTRWAGRMRAARRRQYRSTTARQLGARVRRSSSVGSSCMAASRVLSTNRTSTHAMPAEAALPKRRQWGMSAGRQAGQGSQMMHPCAGLDAGIAWDSAAVKRTKHFRGSLDQPAALRQLKLCVIVEPILP